MTPWPLIFAFAIATAGTIGFVAGAVTLARVFIGPDFAP
jgi:hypothetical protein